MGVDGSGGHKRARGESSDGGGNIFGEHSEDAGNGVQGVGGDKLALRMLLQARQDLTRLADAKSTVIIIRDAKAVQDTVTLRQLWRDNKPKQDMKQEEDGVVGEGKGTGKTKKQFILHPMQKSLKALMHDHFCDLVIAKTASEHSAKKAAQDLKKVDVKELDLYIGDLSPKYSQPREGRAWVWNIVFSDYATPEFCKNWSLMFLDIDKYLTIAKARSTETAGEKALWKKVVSKKSK